MSPPPLRLTLLTLGVADVGRATRFYEAVGLVRAPAGDDDVSFFDVGGCVLAVFGREALAGDAGLAADGAGFRASSLAWNLDSEAAVDEAMARMQGAGAGLVKPAQRTFWGGYAGYVADPDGHLWELAHNPFMPLDADGRLTLPT